MRRATRRRLLFVALLCAGCGKSSSAGGVDVTVSAPGLTAAQLSALSYLLVASSGVESNQYRMVADGLTPTHGQQLWYLPSAQSGLLTIGVSAVDDSGHVLAAGSGMVTLVRGSGQVAIVLAPPSAKPVANGDMGVVGPVVTPAAATVGRNGSVGFSASSSVTWSVVESGGGSIAGDGLYRAPAIPGLYHVLASDGSGGASSVTVTVGFNTLATLAGMPGGSGSRDASGHDARFDFVGGDSSLAANSAGTRLYVADRGNGTIRRVDVATGAVTTIAGVAGVYGANDSPSHPGDGPATFSEPWGVAVDAAEQHLYVSDFGNATIRAIDLTTTPPRVTTVAGQPYIYGYNDAPSGAAAEFNTLLGIALDEKRGLLYVAEFNNCRLRAVAIAGGATTTLAGNGNNASVDSSPGPAQLSNPIGVALDDQAVYVSEAAGTIRKIALANATVTTLAGTAGTFGNGDGTGAAALFGRPNGVASIGSAASGQLVVADPNNGNVRLIVKSSGAVTTLAGATTNPPGLGYADGTGAGARFNGASGVAIAGGDAFVVDNSNSCLRRVAGVLGATHAVTTFVGWPAHNGNANGTGAQAQLSSPYGIVVSGTPASAVAWVADFQNFLVRAVTIGAAATGGYTASVVSLAGSGSEGTTDGKGSAATFGFVPGVVFDGAQTVYALDRDAGAIRSIDTSSGSVKTIVTNVPLPRAATLVDASTLYVTEDSGAVVRVTLPSGPATTVWGAAGNGIVVDGSAAEARFAYPTGIAYDGAGALYVADQSANAIRRLDLASGYVSTVVNVMGVNGYRDGAAAWAQLDSPFALAMLPNGQLLISDNQVVRVYAPASQEVGTVLGVVNAGGVLTGAAPGGLNEPAGLAPFASGELLVTSSAESVVQIAN